MQSKLPEEIRNRFSLMFPPDRYSNGQRIDIEKFLTTEWAQWKFKYDELKEKGKSFSHALMDQNDTLIHENQQLKERCEKMEAALKELCYLKILKEEEGRTNEYVDKQPVAWERAFELTKDTPGKGATLHEGIEKEGEYDSK